MYELIGGIAGVKLPPFLTIPGGINCFKYKENQVSGYEPTKIWQTSYFKATVLGTGIYSSTDFQSREPTSHPIANIRD